MLLFLFLLPVICFAQVSIKGRKVIVASQPVPPANYTYTLIGSASVSAGVFNASGIKVRDLFSNTLQTAGVYTLSWDGNDDVGTPQSNGNYTIKVLTNNVAYTWEGASIGNTSDSLTGAAVHHNFNGCFDNAVIISGTAYVCAGYSEQFPCISAFTTAHPQQKIDLTDRHRTNKWTDWVCSNGTILYWGGRDASVTDSSHTWVSGTLVSNGNDVTFSAGTIISPNNITAESAISNVSTNFAQITGMTTQQGSGYLYVARGGLNNLYCVNNQTGAAVRTISLTNVRDLFIAPNGKLWLIHGSNTIEQYTINSDGTITTTGVTNTTITTPGGLSVSPDGTKLAVCSYDTQQVLFFTPTTGALLSTLGLSGGYSSTPTVANNRFCWKTSNDIGDGNAGKLLTYITFDPADNSYWVGDLGDFRAQHFSSSNTFIESVQYLERDYSTCVDLGNTSRVFGGYLEFSVDYTATLSGSTGWTFVNNWSANISQAYNQQDQFSYVHTFTSSGTSRTFGFLTDLSTGNYDIVELPASGQLRFTGVSRASPVVDEQGNAISNTTVVDRFAFTGFDGSNNPVWSGTAELLADVTSITPITPVHFVPVLQNPITSGNKVMFYESQPYRFNPSNPNTGPHLGAVNKGGNTWNWLNEYGTDIPYMGDFPTAQYFDIGNQVNFSAGTKVTIVDHNVITGYNGEFWKASETNYYNHFWDDGLAVGQFGTNGPDADIIQAPYGMAGNALSPQVFRGSTSDVAWLVHGDESRHSGVHLWKITGLNSVSEQSISITYPNSLLVPTTLPGTNLMSGLPFQVAVPNAANGWTRDAEVSTDPQSAFFNVATGVNSWQPAFPDVNMIYRFTAAPTVKTVVRDLANSATLTSWSLTGILNYANNFPNDGSGQGGGYMEILDVSGKILTRLYITNTSTNNQVHANDKTLLDMAFAQAQLITNHDQNITISAVGGVITFKYGVYTQSTSTLVDPTGNWAKPSSLRFYFFTSVANPGTNVDRIVNYRMGRVVLTP